MRRLMRSTGSRAGFTLMELVVVMTIIAILAGAVVIQVNRNVKIAKRTRALGDIKTLDTAISIYEAHNGNPPSQQQGLAALIAKPSSAPVPPNWQGPYLKQKAIPKDPWGSEYVYTVTGEDEYEITSYGEDGQPGGTGDGTDLTTQDNQ